MYKEILKNADEEQLKRFIDRSLCQLRNKDPEMYEELVNELYIEVFGFHFSDWLLKKVLNEMVNEDGTKGGHWTLEQTSSVARSNEIEFEKYNAYDWCYVMNMIYSDYYGSVPNDNTVYVKMARKFLEDKDAKEGKAYCYWLAMK